MELKDKLVTDTVRFIAPNIPDTRLLAFDAAQQGKGFSFGDGKTNRYYVEGWNSADQSLSWDIRLAKTKKYNVVIKYLAGENSGGSFKLIIDNEKEFDFTVETNKNNIPITKNLFEIMLSDGVHTIEIKPTSITKQELMKLLELQLISSDK